jgi:AcrR family transcriptional regulator
MGPRTTGRPEVEKDGESYIKLRPGPNGPGPEVVVRHQRARLYHAIAELVMARGYAATSVKAVCSLAGVSRRTFYDSFGNEHTMARARERALAAYDAEGGWLESVRAALFALLVFFDEEPGLARLCVVQALAGNPATLLRRGEVIEQLAQVIDYGRGEATGAQAPPLSAHAVVGGVLSVVHARLLDEQPPRLLELLNPLMSMIVLPYLGPAGAQQELSRPAPAQLPAPAERSAYSNLLNGLEMRLTYRTLMVLAVVAREPGLSNRQIGDRAGVRDQGQISKMLTRLAGLGITENSATPGAANAWRLTPKGEAVESRFAGGASSIGS